MVPFSPRKGCEDEYGALHGPSGQLPCVSVACQGDQVGSAGAPAATPARWSRTSAGCLRAKSSSGATPRRHRGRAPPAWNWPSSRASAPKDFGSKTGRAAACASSATTSAGCSTAWASSCAHRGTTRADSRPAHGAARPAAEAVRGIYFATHFHNFYHDAPLEEVQRYVEDLGLWGFNVLAVWYDMRHSETVSTIPRRWRSAPGSGDLQAARGSAWTWPWG